MTVEVPLLVARAGAHQLAVRALEVGRIVAAGELGERPLDLTRRVGAAEPCERAVQLSGGRWILLGAALALRTVPSSTFVAVPAWLDPRTLPLSAAVLLGDRFVWVLDALHLGREA